MATYTVSGGGTALEDCIRALPATASATNPHIIFVEPGVYSPVVLTGKATTHGAAFSAGSKYHIIIGTNRDTCIVDGGGTDVCWQYQTNWLGTFCKIYNMTFRNGIAKAYPSGSNVIAAAVQLCGNARLVNCKICDCVLPPLYTRDDQGVATKLLDSTLVHYCCLHGCEICNNTCTGTSQMIETSCFGCNIHHNYYKSPSKTESETGTEFTSDGRSMICDYPSCGSPFGCERCIIHHNTIADKRSSSTGIKAKGANLCIFAFNENVGNSGHGIFYRAGFAGNGTGHPITHCIFYKNTGFRCLNNLNGDNQGKYENSVCIGNTHPSGFITYLGTTGGGTQAEHCVTDTTTNVKSSNDHYNCILTGVADAGWVDPDNLDFRLLPGSPLIGMGRTDVGKWYYDPKASQTFGWNYGPLTKHGDLSGRPFKEVPSIGCFEYYEDSDPLLPILHPPMFFNPFGR